MRVLVFDIDSHDRDISGDHLVIDYLPDVGDFFYLNDKFFEVRKRLILSKEEVWIDAKIYDKIKDKFSFSQQLLKCM
ncbi:hypothetical protein EDF68_11643 [Ochrobactrum sp. BH3]|nr:hypothetical protein EDF68_11643 [Ochrobactrum sp. BH3]